MTGFAASRHPRCVRRQGREYTEKLVVVPVGMAHRHDHSRNECFYAATRIDTERARSIANIPALLSPATGRYGFVDVIPLRAVGVVFHVAAKTLRHPLAVAGGTGQPVVTVVRAVKLAFECGYLQCAIGVLGKQPGAVVVVVAVSAGDIDGTALVACFSGPSINPALVWQSMQLMPAR